MGVLKGSNRRKEELVWLWDFGVKKMREKEGKSQINPIYRDERENSLAVQLKPFAINGLDCQRVLTVEIKRPFEI